MVSPSNRFPPPSASCRAPYCAVVSMRCDSAAVGPSRRTVHDIMPVMVCDRKTTVCHCRHR